MNNILQAAVMGVGTQGKLAQQNTHYNTMLAAQNAYATMSPYAQYAPTAIPTEPVKWMFDGEYCTINQFADRMWPQDCKEKTFFLLKYTGDINGER